jgi:hypothetical protein
MLTVANWLNKVTFMPVSVYPNAKIEVNGMQLSSGQASQIIDMADEKQIVTISVASTNTGNCLHGIFLQLRPSTECTKVSAGFLTDINVEDGVSYMVMDLVTVEYADGSIVGFTNDAAIDHYNNPVADECILYYGLAKNPIRANDLTYFKAHVTPGAREMY